MPYLDTYSGNWSAKEARHLLKRTSLGVSQALIEQSVSLGLSETIHKLFEEKPLPNLPLKYEFDDEINDPDVNYGETWVNAQPYPKVDTNQDRNRILRYRNRSLYAWSFLQMQDDLPAVEQFLDV